MADPQQRWDDRWPARAELCTSAGADFDGGIAAAFWSDAGRIRHRVPEPSSAGSVGLGGAGTCFQAHGRMLAIA